MKIMSELAFRLLPAFSRRNCLLYCCWSYTHLPSDRDERLFFSEEFEPATTLLEFIAGLADPVLFDQYVPFAVLKLKTDR